MSDQTISIGSGHAVGGTPQYWVDLSPLVVTARAAAAPADTLRPAGVASSDYRDIMISWNGAAYDELRQRLYSALKSGHTNFHDRGTIYFDILADQWVRLTQRNTAAEVGDGSTGIDVTGSPLDTHTYNAELCTPDGCIWIPSMGSVSVSNGIGSPRGWVQDPTNLNQSTPAPYGYTDLGLNTLNGSNDTGAAAYDPIENRVLFAKRTPQGNRSVAAWHPQTRVRTEYTVTGSTTFGDSGEDMAGVVVHDGGSASVLMCKGNGVSGRPIATLDLQAMISGAAVGWTIPTWTGSVQPVGKCCINFNPDTNQLWQWRQGFNQLIVSNAPVNKKTGVYDWFLVTLGGATITQPSGTRDNKIHGTFGRAPQIRMPDGTRGGLVVNEVDEPVFAFKLPTLPMTPG